MNGVMERGLAMAFFPIGGVVLPQGDDHVVVMAAGEVGRERGVRGGRGGRGSDPAGLGGPLVRGSPGHVGVDVEGVRDVKAGVGVLVEGKVAAVFREREVIRVSNRGPMRVSRGEQKGLGTYPAMSPRADSGGSSGTGSDAGIEAALRRPLGMSMAIGRLLLLGVSLR